MHEPEEGATAVHSGTAAAGQPGRLTGTLCQRRSQAMKATIEQQIAGGAEAAGHVHIEKGDTMWSFAHRVLDAVQGSGKGGTP